MLRIRARWLFLGLLAVALPWAPARASAAAELQRMLWEYGDSGTESHWTGADGTYSVELPDGRIAWLFSDTFLGTVNEDGSRAADTPFVHNSMIVQDGEELTTRVGPYGLRSLVEPPDRVSFYWVGDGVVEHLPEGDELLVFVNRFVAAPIPFAFQQVGTDIARFALPSLELEGVTPMPLAFAPGVGAVPVSYGSAVLTDGGYHYIYGVEDIHADKYLHLARGPVGQLLDATSWEYWGLDGWSAVPAATRLLAGVANELSVTRVASGEYVLVTQDHAIGRRIMVSRAPAPEGPWSAPVAVYDTSAELDASFLSYNAKAHEQLSAPGKLLVSYNVNTLVPGDLYADVASYRPRFVEITL